MSSYTDLKEECWTANVALPRLGLAQLTFGNASVVDRQRGVFAIKPSGANYAALTVDEIVVLDLDGKLVEGTLRPSSDTATHRCLLQEFTGIRAVVHTHSPNAVAFAQAGRSVPCLGTTHADYFHGEVPVTRAMTPAEIGKGYEWETGRVIVERFGNLDPLRIPGVLVRNHGPFTWGESGAKAVENAAALELIATMALQTMHINPAAEPISPALLDKHFLRKHGADAYYGQA